MHVELTLHGFITRDCVRCKLALTRTILLGTVNSTFGESGTLIFRGVDMRLIVRARQYLCTWTTENNNRIRTVQNESLY